MEKNNKKGGRPKKGLGQKKTYRINIKLITEEYYSLVAKVRNAKTNISVFVRDCLKNGYVKERISPEQVNHIRQLCGMANNLNQLARKANTQGYEFAASECLQLANKIDAIIKEIEL